MKTFAAADLLAHLTPEHRQSYATAGELIKALRTRPYPRTGYDAGLVSRLRERATDKQVTAAKEAIEAALREDLVTGAHTNAFCKVGDVRLIIGLDESLMGRMAERTIEQQTLWGQGPWGATRSICDLLRILMAIPEVEDEALAPFLCWLNEQQQAEWAWARTWGEQMLGTSGHNWWLHTYIGFWECGLYFPQFKGFAQFESFAPGYFEHEMHQLMAADGFTMERSGYHWGTVDHWFKVHSLAQINGISFSPSFMQRLRAMGDTLWQTMTPNRYVPCFGDCGAKHTSSNTTQLRVAAALLDLPEAKALAEALEPEWQPPYGMLLYAGRDLLPAYRRVQAKLPDRDCVLPDSGFFFMRSDWTPTADYLALQAGDLGTIVTSHAHTDMFTFELYSHGRPVIIDNCSGPYGTDESRLWRVGSASHNVATVDDMDHLPMQNEWRWSGQLTPHIDNWQSTDRYAYLSAAHEGYRLLPEPIEAVRRKVFYLRGGYTIILDRFTPGSAAEHLYTLHFQILGANELLPDGRLVTLGEGGNVLIVPVPGLNGEAAIEPCPWPLDGYDNPDHLTYSRRSCEKLLFATLLVPFTGEKVPTIDVQSMAVHADGHDLPAWEATGLKIEVDGRTDYYVDQHMQWNLPWQVGPCQGDGRLYHSQAHD